MPIGGDGDGDVLMRVLVVVRGFGVRLSGKHT